MIGQRFERAFEQLLVAWRQYDANPRDPQDIAELARVRTALDYVRREVAAARRTALTGC